MENATDALYIGFAVLVFVLALTISITMFTQLNRVSSIVISSTDITNFYEYEGSDANKTSRIVGLETIIPTLYKYYKENYTVIFIDSTGKPLHLYNSISNRDLWGNGINSATGKDPNIGNIGKYYTENKNLYEQYDNYPVCAFDYDEEIIRHEPWIGNSEDYKRNIDAFLNGGIFSYSSNPGQIAYNYTTEIGNGGFIGQYGCYKFKEMIGEYTYNISSTNDNELLKNRKKRVIIYQINQ